MKKGRKRRNWKRRYFVLSDDWSSISYYEDERCLKERGRVNLGGARCDLGLDYVPKRAHVFAFTLRARDDVYHLECSSEGERQRWLRTLKTASTSARDDARGLRPDRAPWQMPCIFSNQFAGARSVVTEKRVRGAGKLPPGAR